MKQKLGRILGLAAISSAAALALVAPAQAVVYTGVWDPAYGGAFANLGWRATADLYVPNACAAAVGTQAVNNQLFDNPPFSSRFGNVADCAALSLDNVTLYFYDQNDLSKTTLESFVLGSYGATSNDASYGEIEDQSLTSVNFVAGVPVGFETSASFRVTPSVPAALALAGGGLAAFSLTLSLNPNSVRLWYLTDGQTVSDAARREQFGEYAPEITFREANVVPEPGSLALVLAALAAAGLAVRRSRA